MKILHTSDWHLGQNFMGKSREEEHQAFFVWLLKTIQSNNITILIVAGDIFDTTTPPNYALELYYNFLKKLSTVEGLTTIITAGNHDSVSTLRTSQQLLKALNIYVIATGEEDNQIVPIYQNDKLKMVVCAVPFLRDAILRKTVSNEGIREREKLINSGIEKYYAEIHQKAIKQLKDKGLNQKEIPIVATGHLTTVGARSSESERDIYIGGTLDIGGDFLGKYFDYVALGHLHRNQKVRLEHVCYSGSPIPLSFSEAKGIKKVNMVEFKELKSRVVKVTPLEIPTSRPLLLLKGNVESIVKELNSIEEKETWIEVQLTNDDNPFASNHTIRALANKLGLTLLAVKIEKSEKKLESKEMNVINLDELGVGEVFEKRLDMENLESGDLKNELLNSFKKIVAKVENR